jgi:hypothetical protein
MSKRSLLLACDGELCILVIRLLHTVHMFTLPRAPLSNTVIVEDYGLYVPLSSRVLFLENSFVPARLANLLLYANFSLSQPNDTIHTFFNEQKRRSLRNRVRTA